LEKVFAETVKSLFRLRGPEHTETCASRHQDFTGCFVKCSQATFRSSLRGSDTTLMLPRASGFILRVVIEASEKTIGRPPKCAAAAGETQVGRKYVPNVLACFPNIEARGRRHGHRETVAGRSTLTDKSWTWVHLC